VALKIQISLADELGGKLTPLFELIAAKNKVQLNFFTVSMSNQTRRRE